MRKTACRRWAAAVLALTALPWAASAQANLSLEDVLAKNLEASGGREGLGRVHNFSFKAGTTRVFVSSAGEVKILTGKDPVVTEALSVVGDRVLRNSYRTTGEITGPQKAVYRTLADIYAGLFSLDRFRGRLKLIGLKAYGPEKLYCLTSASKVESLDVDFFLRSDDFRLKRLVFRGTTPEGDKYEVNYDFAPFEETAGLKIPLSWFGSQVGTRGTLTEVAEVVTNQPLAEGFFSRLEVNIGTVEAAPGELKGQVLDFNSSPYGLGITTNWRKEDAEKAGFKTGDKLFFSLEGVEAELVFYASAGDLPPQEELVKGARLMTLMPRGGETFTIQFIAVDTAPLAAKLKPLAAVSVNKISN